MSTSHRGLHILIAQCFVTTAVALCIAICLVGCGLRERSPEELQVFCAAGMMRPMEELRQLFEKESGTTVQVSYAGSGVHLGQLSAGRPCDVFVPADMKYVDDADRNGWVDSASRVSVALHVPILAVSRRGAEKITCLSDLTVEGIRIGSGDPKACAIGRYADNIFLRAGIPDAVNKNVNVRTPTVNELLIYLTMDQIDAAIIWEDLARLPEANGKLRTIAIPQEQNVVGTIAAVRGTHCEQPDRAEAFVEFLVSDRAQAIWRKCGFTPCDE